jgi:eukaryotic-like serine/threonine-protein kinase
MRKSRLIEKGLIFLMIFLPVQLISGQQFGTVPLKECWRIENDSISLIEVASDNDLKLFFISSEGFIEAVNKFNGEILWKTEIGGEILPQIIFDSQRVFTFSKKLSPDETISDKSNGIIIHSLSASTGITNWQKKVPLPNSLAAGEEIFLAENSEILFLSTKTGIFIGISKQNGKILFEKNNSAEITSPPLLQDGKIYFGTKDKKIKTISLSNWLASDVSTLPSALSSILINGNSNLFVGDERGNVLSLETRHHALRWKTRTGAEVTNIAKIEGGILVLSLDNYVYLLSEKNGSRIWKKRLSGRSIGKPLIKNGVAVFSTYGGTDAVFIELKKGKIINQLFIADDNYFTSNPKSFGDFIFFQTRKGILAYNAADGCLNKK